MQMSGCRVNMFVMLYKYCIVFKGASYLFKLLSQNKPFGVHEQFMAEKFKVNK